MGRKGDDKGSWDEDGRKVVKAGPREGRARGLRERVRTPTPEDLRIACLGRGRHADIPARDMTGVEGGSSGDEILVLGSP